MPSLPNQPSEASAHFMFELAKTVLVKAGGNSSTSLFINQSPATSNTQTHRALHLCAFQIGLYALGLNNCVSPNWLSRTYSSHVSWITGFICCDSITWIACSRIICHICKNVARCLFAFYTVRMTGMRCGGKKSNIRYGNVKLVD